MGSERGGAPGGTSRPASRRGTVLLGAYGLAVAAWLAWTQWLIVLSGRDAIPAVLLGLLQGGGFAVVGIALLLLIRRDSGRRRVSRSLVAEPGEIERLRRIAAVLESTGEGILIIGPDGRVLDVNQAFTAFTGYTRGDVVGSPLTDMDLSAGEGTGSRMWDALLTEGRWSGDVRHHRRSGGICDLRLSASVVRDDDGTPTHYVAVLSDVSRIRATEKRVDYLTRHDPLTGLLNRESLTRRLAGALVRGAERDDLTAVLVVDLDHFKKINDSLGHPAGDRLLMAVARRLGGVVRHDAAIGRMGDDGFLIAIRDVAGIDAVQSLARRILYELRRPFSLSRREVFVTASIGISVAPRDGSTAIELIKNADAALYQAKRNRRGTFCLYRREMSRAATERLTLESDLHRALERDELELCFQPQVGLEAGQVVGAEALIRWRHPVRGLIGPDAFLPVAEESGLIGAIDHWVLRRACETLAHWQARGWALRLAVNLSAQRVVQETLVRDVTGALRDTGVDPGFLELEITEGCIMQEPAVTARTLQELRALGVTLAIDDFGTGYSSLGHLKRFPVHRLKVDQAFTRDIPQDPANVAIVQAVVALCQGLGLKVLAEGVETEGQRRAIRELGCPAGQGYLFGRPVALAEFERRWAAPVAAGSA